VTIWITVAIGSIIGGLWGDCASPRASGRVGNMLLGITGALSARWLVDLFVQLGVKSLSFAVILTLCGAALLPWCFHGFERSVHLHWPRSATPKPVRSMPPTKDHDRHNRVTAA
jgi:uncharacterized membrane protein YeaQ/YmgE (transglycosylase-associated protein family)